MFGKISRRSLASVVFPLDEQPLIPTTTAFLSTMGQGEGVVFGKESRRVQVVVNRKGVTKN